MTTIRFPFGALGATTLDSSTTITQEIVDNKTILKIDLKEDVSLNLTPHERLSHGADVFVRVNDASTGYWLGFTGDYIMGDDVSIDGGDTATVGFVWDGTNFLKTLEVVE